MKRSTNLYITLVAGAAVVGCARPAPELKAARSLRAHKGQVQGIAVAPDGGSFVTVGDDYKLIVRTLPEAATLTSKTFSDRFRSVDISPDGRLVATGDTGGFVRVFDYPSLRAVWKWNPEKGPITEIRFAPDGKSLVAATSKPEIEIISVERMRPARTVRAHETTVYAVSFSADGKRAVTTSYDKSVKVWETERWSVVREWRDFKGPVPGGAISPDGKLVATASWDDRIRVFEVETGRERFFAKANGKPFSVVFAPDSSQVAATVSLEWLPELVAGPVHYPAQIRGAVVLFHAETGEELQTFSPLHGGGRATRFSSDGRLFTGDGHGNLTILQR